MSEKQEILKELEREFKNLKKELKLNIELEELDEVFHIKNMVLSEGYVGENLSRQICSRISDTFGNWTGYLNNLVLPNSSYIPSQTEAKLFFSAEDKKRIWALITGAMKLISKNSLDIIKADKILQKEIIEGSLIYWKEEFSPNVAKIMRRIHDAWAKD